MYVLLKINKGFCSKQSSLGDFYLGVSSTLGFYPRIMPDIIIIII